MGGEPNIRQRSYDFALRVVKFVRTLPKNTVGSELGRELLKSGTSIGANTEEATGGFSKKDFTYKMSVAYREARVQLLAQTASGLGTERFARAGVSDKRVSGDQEDAQVDCENLKRAFSGQREVLSSDYGLLTVAGPTDNC